MWISGICDFLEIWLPGKCFFKENVTSWEVRLPRKCEFLLKYDFPANLTFTGAAEKHGWQGFVNIGLRTFPKIRLPRKCDFPGSVTSWELWLPRKNEFNLTLRILIMFATPPQVQYMVSIFFTLSLNDVQYAWSYTPLSLPLSLSLSFHAGRCGSPLWREKIWKPYTGPAAELQTWSIL